MIRMIYASFVAVVVIAVGGAAPCTRTEAQTVITGPARVIDADTVVIIGNSGSVTVRLKGVDAAELSTIRSARAPCDGSDCQWRPVELCSHWRKNAGA